MTTSTPTLRTLHAPAATAAGRRTSPHRGRLRPWALFVVIVILAFFGLTYSRISLDRSAFVLETLQDQIAAEESLHYDLRVQVAELRDPERIAEVAVELGMVFPGRRVDLAVQPVGGAELDPEYRWAQLRALLGAQP
jgi:hypothetical protein